MITAVLIDFSGNVVKEAAWPHDPRLRGVPNWIETEDYPPIPLSKDEAEALPVTQKSVSMYFFEGEIRDDGALIFRERI